MMVSAALRLQLCTQLSIFLILEFIFIIAVRMFSLEIYLPAKQSKSPWPPSELKVEAA